jgi:hypothetical protein
MAAPRRVLFLATDTPQVRDEARRRYGARAYFQQVPVAHTGQQLSRSLALSLARSRSRSRSRSLSLCLSLFL